jgi:coenzyme F420-reducing hydrogenase gamma subunit
MLDCEDELLALAGAVEIAHFTEASSADVAGPYDVSLVEGSVTTERDARRITEIRAASRVLISIGACATSGGIQALRNFADVAEFTSVVYARPEYISALATSTPVADHVKVDFELRGCPIDKGQLFEAPRHGRGRAGPRAGHVQRRISRAGFGPARWGAHTTGVRSDDHAGCGGL